MLRNTKKLWKSIQLCGVLGIVFLVAWPVVAVSAPAAFEAIEGFRIILEEARKIPGVNTWLLIATISMIVVTVGLVGDWWYHGRSS